MEITEGRGNWVSVHVHLPHVPSRGCSLLLYDQTYLMLYAQCCESDQLCYNARSKMRFYLIIYELEIITFKKAIVENLGIRAAYEAAFTSHLE